jgi:S-adenosylmethionine:tRNA ribosyltransferase-isomerase
MNALAPATWPRNQPDHERMLVIDPSASRFEHSTVGEIGTFLRRGDVVVLNDSATLPASLSGVMSTEGRQAPIEVRLLARDDETTFRAILFGQGDWRTRTEDRPLPPSVSRPTRARFGTLNAELLATDTHPRLVRVRFDSTPDLESRLFLAGKYVQYAHVREALDAWHVQTSFASRPWSFEMPSASRPLTWSLLSKLRVHGVELARLTPAAGLSSTGDESLDALLPLDERYEIFDDTVAAIQRARESGGRVLAVGTTVVRALEGNFASNGALKAGVGVTSLRISPDFVPRVTDGIFTGMHEAGTSHARLMGAYAPVALLDRAWNDAASRGYLGHEFGDSTLILSTP